MLKTCHTFLKTTVAGLLLLLSHFAQAQENFVPGYIILLNKDTAQGLVDYRKWDVNPDRIAFKEKGSETKFNYTPLEIRGFGVAGYAYESAIVEIETSPTSTGELTHDAVLNFKRETTFIKPLIRGSKNLYYFKTAVGKEQFYMKDEAGYTLLVYKKYLIDKGGATSSIENKKFIGQLAFYLQDCKLIQSKLGSTTYSKKSMEDLFQHYYKCTGQEVKFQKKAEKLKTEFGVLAGFINSSIAFKGYYFPDLANATYPASTNFTGGVSFNVALPGDQSKWSIQNEALFVSFKTNGHYEDITSPNFYTIADLKLGGFTLKVNNMIRYAYPIGKLALFVNAGLSSDFVLKEINYKKTESKFYSSTTIKEGKAMERTRKFEIGYMVGVGARFKQFTLDGRYGSSDGMSNYPDLTSVVKSYYVLLGYTF